MNLIKGNIVDLITTRKTNDGTYAISFPEVYNILAYELKESAIEDSIIYAIIQYLVNDVVFLGIEDDGECGFIKVIEIMTKYLDKNTAYKVVREINKIIHFKLGNLIPNFVELRDSRCLRTRITSTDLVIIFLEKN